MSVGNEILQNLSHYPDGLTHPIETVETIAAATALYVGVKAWHRHAGEKTAEAFGGNHELAEQAVISVRGGLETRASRRRRLAPALTLVAGAGLAAAGYFGNPTYDNPHSNAEAKEVVVVDASLSMQNTADIGTTRYDAAIKSLEGLNDYKGSLAVVTSGADNKVSLPLAQNWRGGLEGLKKPEVDPNGGNLASAIDTAISILPGSGNAIVISDGTISSSEADMKKAAEAAHKAGVSVKIVVPGDPNSGYKIAGQEFGSGVQPQVFADFGIGNVEQATTAAEVASDVNRAVAESSTVHKREPWRVPLFAGLLTMAGSVAVMSKRVIARN